jgi:putative chitinase
MSVKTFLTNVISPPKPTVTGLKNSGAFYDQIRLKKLFGPVFSTTEFEGVQNIISNCGKAGWPIAYTAYALATAYHETAGTMQPIKEYGGYQYYMKKYDISGDNPTRARANGNLAIGDGARYCGRGEVQLTWKNNYARAGKALGIDLVNVPDLALNPDYASQIMIRGMQEGWFTGKKMADYLPEQGPASSIQFGNARRIINGQDDASLIAVYALTFQEGLVRGQWS